MFPKVEHGKDEKSCSIIQAKIFLQW